MDKTMHKPERKQPHKHNIKAPKATRRSGVARYSSSAQSRPQTSLKKLKQVHGSMNPFEIWLSKLMHRKYLEDFFSLIDATVGRASGVLGAAMLFAVVSLVGPLCYRYFGYDYTYLINIAGLLVGYICGLVVELMYAQIKKS